MTALVLSAYPLTADYRQRLTEVVSDPLVFLHLNELRLLKPLAAIAKIRAMNASLCVAAIEDQSSFAALAVLQVLAAMSGAKTIELAHPDIRRERITRVRALASVIGMAVATLDGVLASFAHRRGIDRLARAARLNVTPSATQSLLYLNPNLWFGLRAGGAVSHMTGVVNAFTDLGYDVDFASTVPLPLLRRASSNRMLMPLKHLGLPAERNYFRFQRKMLKQLREMTGSNHYSFIYQRMSVHNYAGVLVSRLARLPLVLEYNGSEAWIADHWGRPLQYRQLALAAEAVCLRHAHLVVTVSDELRQQVLSAGVEADRVITCPNGFDPSVFDPDRFAEGDIARCRVKLGVPTSSTVVTFVGTFGRWHGVEVFARAIRELVVKSRERFAAARLRFVLIGDGARMPEVRDILGSECDAFVTMLGLLPAEVIPLHLAASDVLVAPHVPNDDGTEFFGSPTKLFEYMAMRRAIVASDLGQLGHVLSPALQSGDLPANGPSGAENFVAVLVPPAEVPSLARAIRFLAANPKWRSALGIAARERALERHTWEHQVRRILTALRSASST